MINVGIFGYYRFKNFGDDLMALMIARHVIDSGHQATVLGLDESIAASVGAQVVDSAEELAACSDVLILGGGAALSDFNANSCSQNQMIFDRDCFNLASLARKRAIPCLAISIGGNSKGLSRGVRTGVMMYLVSPVFAGATTRLQSDNEFLKNALSVNDYNSSKIESYPDIVLTLRHIFPEIPTHSRSEKHNAVTIAVNLGKHKNENPLIRVLHYYGKTGQVNCIFVHNSCQERERFIQWKPFTRGDNHIAFDHPLEVVKFLSKCDLVISHRLHLGVAALAVDVPFLSFNAWDKTKLFMSELGWQKHELTTRFRKLPALLNQIHKESKRIETQLFTLPHDLSAAKQASAGHLRWLSQSLSDILVSHAAQC